jgi:hypothetical protein
MSVDVTPRRQYLAKANSLPRLIFVVDDAAPGSRIQGDQPGGSNTAPEPQAPSSDPVGQVGGTLGGLGRGVADGLGRLGEGAAGVLKGLRGEGVDAKAVSRSDAAMLDFPPGHPQERVLYVQHPVELVEYLPAAYFHHRVFEHKFWEAVRVLMSLGASQLHVMHVAGWADEFAASIKTPTGFRPRLDGKRGRGARLLFVGELEGSESAEIPPGLVWFKSEPSWQAIAEGRIKRGLKHFTMEVRYVDDFGVNAGLETAAGKVGLGLGGKFQAHKATIWWIDATFGTAPSRLEAQTTQRETLGKALRKKIIGF